VGSSHIKGVISALEYHRFNNQHLYAHIPEALVSLRTDSRIKVFEKAAQHNEPSHADKAHILKAAGSSAGNVCLFVICTEYLLLMLLPRYLHQGGAYQLLSLLPQANLNWAPDYFYSYT